MWIKSHLQLTARCATAPISQALNQSVLLAVHFSSVPCDSVRPAVGRHPSVVSLFRPQAWRHPLPIFPHNCRTLTYMPAYFLYKNTLYKQIFIKPPHSLASAVINTVSFVCSVGKSYDVGFCQIYVPLHWIRILMNCLLFDTRNKWRYKLRHVVYCTPIWY